MIKKWLEKRKQDRRDAERYHRLVHQIHQLHRWCGMMPQVEATAEWMLDGDFNHWRDIETEGKHRWPSDISSFRSAIQKMSPQQNTKTED